MWHGQQHGKETWPYACSWSRICLASTAHTKSHWSRCRSGTLLSRYTHRRRSRGYCMGCQGPLGNLKGLRKEKWLFISSVCLFSAAVCYLLFLQILGWGKACKYFCAEECKSSCDTCNCKPRTLNSLTWFYNSVKKGVVGSSCPESGYPPACVLLGWTLRATLSGLAKIAWDPHVSLWNPDRVSRHGYVSLDLSASRDPDPVCPGKSLSTVPLWGWR